MPTTSAPATSQRLLALLSLLQTRRDWPGPLLAERLQVSERTVRRDVDRLRELDYAILAVKGPDGGYRLDASTRMPPLLFDDEQVVALAVALRNALVTGAGIEEAAARALVTVRQVMPARLRGRLDALEFSVGDDGPGHQPHGRGERHAVVGQQVHGPALQRVLRAPSMRRTTYSRRSIFPECRGPPERNRRVCRPRRRSSDATVPSFLTNERNLICE